MDNTTGTTKSAMGSATKALPAETIDNICEYLTSDGILSLRAICRDTCRKVQDPFLTRFFTQRRQLISKPSLKQFLDISAHPILRQKLKSVEFVKAELSSKWRPCYGPRQNRNNMCSSSSVARRPFLPYSHMECVHWLEEEEEQVADKWHDYANALGDLLELDEITLALQNLKKAGIMPALKVSGDLWDGICGNNPAHGVHELHRVLGLAVEENHPLGSPYVSPGDRPFAHPLDSGADATKLVLKSIAEAEFAVQDLVMSFHSLPVRFTDFSFVDRPDLNVALRSNMYDLRSLSFTLKGCIESQDTDELGIMLSAAPLLHSLAICFDYREPAVPHGICAAFAGLKLKSLELFHARMPSRPQKHSCEPAEYAQNPEINVGRGYRMIGENAICDNTVAVQRCLADLIADAEKEPTEYDSAEDEGDDVSDDDGIHWEYDEELREYSHFEDDHSGDYYGTEEGEQEDYDDGKTDDHLCHLQTTPGGF